MNICVMYVTYHLYQNLLVDYVFKQVEFRALNVSQVYAHQRKCWPRWKPARVGASVSFFCGELCL